MAVIGIACRMIYEANHKLTFSAVANSYIESVAAAGGVPLLIPASAVGLSAVQDYVKLCDGMLFAGGEDLDPSRYGQAHTPQLRRTDETRDALELALYNEARRQRCPILGVCRGLQLINVACGGTLIQDLPSTLPTSLNHDPAEAAWEDRVHSVTIAPDTKLYRAIGVASLSVNSFHHQVIDRLGDGLMVSARSTGDDVIEAVEDPTSPFLVGVQWHPEVLWQAEPSDTMHLGVFKALVAAASQTR